VYPNGARKMDLQNKVLFNMLDTFYETSDVRLTSSRDVSKLTISQNKLTLINNILLKVLFYKF
jgi:hypothetical protein